MIFELKNTYDLYVRQNVLVNYKSNSTNHSMFYFRVKILCCEITAALKVHKFKINKSVH